MEGEGFSQSDYHGYHCEAGHKGSLTFSRRNASHPAVPSAPLTPSPSTLPAHPQQLTLGGPRTAEKGWGCVDGREGGGNRTACQQLPSGMLGICPPHTHTHTSVMMKKSCMFMSDVPKPTLPHSLPHFPPRVRLPYPPLTAPQPVTQLSHLRPSTTPHTPHTSTRTRF